MADNLQNKAVEQAVNYFQVSELQFIIFCLLILVLWFIGTYYLQSRFQKNVMKDIALQKEEIEKRLRNIDYKNDYYKKIIDKRIDAYEKLNELILDLHKFSSLSNKGKKKVYPLRFASIANVEELFEKIGDFHKSEIWISFSTVGIIHQYVDLLATIVTDLRSNDDNFIVLKDYIEDCKYSALEKYTGKNKFDDLISNIEENLEWLRNKNMSAIVEERKLDYKSLAVGMALNEIIKSINNILIEKYMDDFKELNKIDDFLDFNQ